MTSRTFVLALGLGASLTLAPFQCARDPDPNLRREDTAGDALWALAQDFRGRGNEPAARETLRYLVVKYPSSRYAPAAREELGRGADDVGAASP